jgi:hypothetical protein
VLRAPRDALAGGMGTVSMAWIAPFDLSMSAFATLAFSTIAPVAASTESAAPCADFAFVVLSASDVDSVVAAREHRKRTRPFERRHDARRFDRLRGAVVDYSPACRPDLRSFA